MQEFLWEIWAGKRNTHHRAQMDLNETPGSVFQRIVKELKGTDKAIQTTRRDPNTGQKAEVKWKFSFRSQGKEETLKSHQSFAQQGVTEGALMVVREVELRAHTIYIDGIDGLADEEIAAARSKVPLIVGILLFLLIGGGAGYYFLVYVPQQKLLAPIKVSVMTEPKGAKLLILMDVSQVPKQRKGPPRPAGMKKKAAKKKAGERVQKLSRIKVLTPARNVKIPKKAKIIFIQISKKGFKNWTAGYTLDVWNKDQLGLRKLLPIDPKELAVKNYFPKNLDKLPPAPRFPPVAPPAPTAPDVKYPRRWRKLRVGIEPMHGGLDHQGASGVSGKTAGDLNLLLANALVAHLAQKRRKYRVSVSRKKDAILKAPARLKRLRRARVIVQLDFASGIKELPKASKTLKRDQKLIPYNDAVGGFQILWSKKNKKAKSVQKLAACLGQWMKKAGFKPRPARKGEPATASALGIREASAASPILDGKIPAVRLIPGYISHRGEDAILNKAETHKVLSKAIEGALICYNSK